MSADTESGITWKLTAHAGKRAVQQALLVHDEIEDWDPELVIAGRELAEDRPEDWVLEGWYPREPGAEQEAALAGLFTDPRFAENPPEIAIERLEPQDWLTLSQQNVQPIRAGRFHVHTSEFPPDADAIDFTIPASQAFGTGQHRTTAGCLEMLSHMKAKGLIARRIADIGTGTGLLGFAALRLWPLAHVTASDVDEVCAEVVAENAALNGIELGPRPGQMAFTVAEGMEHDLLRVNAPYNLVIANILAGPLIELARDFSAFTAPGGSVLLAGLLAGEQEQAVRRAYRSEGLHLVGRLQRGDWAILWLRKRRERFGRR